MYHDGRLQQYKEKCFYVIGTRNVLYGIQVPFTLPKTARFISMTGIGAGGNGGSGASNTAGVNRNGGSGGGSAAITNIIYPARALPSTIFLLPGFNNGSPASTYIQADPGTASVNNIILQASSANSASAGAATAATVNFIVTRALSYNN